MDVNVQEASVFGVKHHPRTAEQHIIYGTAGFRTKSDVLDHVMYRVGLLAALRSKSQNATIGMMVTASHNPECDNGIKLVDPRGEMLDISWEKHATRLANAEDDLVTVLRSIIEVEKIDVSRTASVIIARDTRQSSKPLSQSAVDGAENMGAKVTNCGVLTTPQLHYIVCCHNNPTYGEPTEAGYYRKISTSFADLNKRADCTNYTSKLTVDCANGVGALKLRELTKLLPSTLTISVCNDGSVGQLNHNCGADYVKVYQRHPEGVTPAHGTTFASFDGDADRVVYFYFDAELRFHLLDGDKIATLIAVYLLGLIEKSGLPLKLGIVQTAYANGSSTTFMKEILGVEVACVCTGVKYLHHRAQQFDVGVYFEANGHGTVLFNESATKMIHSTGEDESLTEEQKQTKVTLRQSMDLINQTVGDAMSDMLLIETILRSVDQNCAQWDGMYEDLPNRQLKIKVCDRSLVTTTDADRAVVTPDGLQDAIDKLAAGYNKGRSFVRASGTEDIVRVYAEADSRENADRLATEVAIKVYDLVGGVGDKPRLVCGGKDVF